MMAIYKPRACAAWRAWRTQKRACHVFSAHHVPQWASITSITRLRMRTRRREDGVSGPVSPSWQVGGWAGAWGGASGACYSAPEDPRRLQTCVAERQGVRLR